MAEEPIDLEPFDPDSMTLMEFAGLLDDSRLTFDQLKTPGYRLMMAAYIGLWRKHGKQPSWKELGGHRLLDISFGE